MKSKRSGNIYADLPSARKREVFTTLARGKGLLIERIVSRGQATTAGKWLKEARDEWVIVLRGAAVLRFRSPDRKVELKEGDYILIPANTPHRVERTHKTRKTVWLAIHR